MPCRASAPRSHSSSSSGSRGRRPVVRRTAWLPARRLSSTARQEKRKLEELAQQQAEEIDMLRLELKGRDTVR